MGAVRKPRKRIIDENGGKGWLIEVDDATGGRGGAPVVIRRWLARRAERQRHDDRDPDCRYWWGDRAGGGLSARCPVCQPS